MNLKDLFNLKPGILIKGIDNSTPGKSILNLDGWKNNTSGSYGIRWLEDVEDLDFDILNHRTFTPADRFDYFTPTKTAKNGTIYISSQKDLMFDYKTVQIGDPIGMFLGESIYCAINELDNMIVLLKILDVTKVGWIVVGSPNCLSPTVDFEIY
jgi:hypothetical protein